MTLTSRMDSLFNAKCRETKPRRSYSPRFVTWRIVCSQGTHIQYNSISRWHCTSPALCPIFRPKGEHRGRLRPFCDSPLRTVLHGRLFWNILPASSCTLKATFCLYPYHNVSARLASLPPAPAFATTLRGVQRHCCIAGCKPQRSVVHTRSRHWEEPRNFAQQLGISEGYLLGNNVSRLKLKAPMHLSMCI